MFADKSEVQTYAEKACEISYETLLVQDNSHAIGKNKQIRRRTMRF